jgi:hypothetical protein
MLGQVEEAQFLRETAAELRRIAGYSAFLEPPLVRKAQELEKRAAEFENEPDGVSDAGITPDAELEASEAL